MSGAREKPNCRCCQAPIRPTGVLGGVLSCGCESATCWKCNKCRNHCTCPWGRDAKIQAIADAAQKRMSEQKSEFTFEEKSGHIINPEGFAVAYCHVTEWGNELVEILNRGQKV